MARVLVELVVRLLRDRVADGEGRRVHHWIVHANAVVDHLRIDAREALGDLQLLAVRPVRRADAVGEIRRLDDERVAFPVAARVAHVLPDVRADVRTAVERDDARVVDHLVADDDLVRCLHDAQAVAVQHRRDARDPARDAAIVEREVAEVVERAAPERADAE